MTRKLFSRISVRGQTTKKLLVFTDDKINFVLKTYVYGYYLQNCVLKDFNVSAKEDVKILEIYFFEIF